MKATRRDIGSRIVQDIAWEQSRERARRQQRYLKMLMAIHAKKRAEQAPQMQGDEGL